MPQPIDPQTELGRITAAERIQQIADRASLAAQARASQTAANELTAAESQVRQMAAKSEEVERELRRRTPFVGKRKQKKESGDHEEQLHKFYTADEREEVAEDPEDHDLDVTV